MQWTFAFGIAMVMKVYEPLVAPRKRKLLADLHGKVLEIGPGTGPTLKHFPKNIHWSGLENNPHMHQYLSKELVKHGIAGQPILGSAMEIPLPDHSVDFVVSSLVLCSVPDPQLTLSEIFRVLKPGGQFRFIEHVAAKEGTWIARVQKFVKPIWFCCAAGCTLNRKTWVTVYESELKVLWLEHFSIKFPFISPHIWGSAQKPFSATHLSDVKTFISEITNFSTNL